MSTFPLSAGRLRNRSGVSRRSLLTPSPRRRRSLLTAVYIVAKRPKGRVLVDYNQNAWGRTLASIYSVRPRPKATVSTPVEWAELERGLRSKTSRWTTCRRGFSDSVICGSRCWRSGADSNLKLIFKVLREVAV